jgi:transcriptional regulator with XRE-family HTH domain
MAERRNGNITIIAGLPEPPGPTPDTQRMNLSGKQVLAFRLRKQGWSYRRIADALGVSYPQVLDWMEADSPPAPPVLVARSSVMVSLTAANQEPTVAAAPAPITVSPVIAPELLLQRLDALVAEQRAQAAAIAGLERRLIDVVKAEAKSLGKRIQDAIKGLKKPPAPPKVG